MIKLIAIWQNLYSSDKDKQPSNIADNLPTDIEVLKEKQQKLSDGLELLEKLKKKKQHNLTDPDATLMQKPAHNLMAYNTQIVVDDKFKLIVATDVSSKGNDSKQLHKMSEQTKEILKVEILDIVADAGYFSAKEIKKCADGTINIIVPSVNRNKEQINKGKYPREKFEYDKKKDCYICPNNQKLSKKNPQFKDEKKYFKYSTNTSTCKLCKLKDKCISLKATYKQLYRWEHEEIIDKHKQKMKTQESKAIIKRRGSIVEHPFGTIKRMLGWDHFLVRGKEKVSGRKRVNYVFI